MPFSIVTHCVLLVLVFYTRWINSKDIIICTKHNKKRLHTFIPYVIHNMFHIFLLIHSCSLAWMIQLTCMQNKKQVSAYFTSTLQVRGGSDNTCGGGGGGGIYELKKKKKNDNSCDHNYCRFSSFF